MLRLSMAAARRMCLRTMGRVCGLNAVQLLSSDSALPAARIPVQLNAHSTAQVNLLYILQAILDKQK